MGDIDEFGYNRESGFIWIIQKKNEEDDRSEDKGASVLALFVVEMYFETPSSGKLTFKAGIGLSDNFVVEMYFETPSSGKLTFKAGIGLSDNLKLYLISNVIWVKVSGCWLLH
ncbi:uncharacterized protein A4U43_C08F13120 [Asparagus officinalis]|nr:uncharacterized protein A4U43_C08F13120 [Asparagus officinalis]